MGYLPPFNAFTGRRSEWITATAIVDSMYRQRRAAGLRFARYIPFYRDAAVAEQVADERFG